MTPPAPPARPGYRTAFQGYSVRFSPFEDGRLAVATSQNYGIVGNGRQYVLQVDRGEGACSGPLVWGRAHAPAQARNVWVGVLCRCRHTLLLGRQVGRRLHQERLGSHVAPTAADRRPPLHARLLAPPGRR